MGDLELSVSAAAVSSVIGISLSAIEAPVVVAAVAIIGLIAGVIGTIQSLFMIAQSTGGIYSTATGTGTFYDKVEAFAHDFIIMVVGMVTLTGSVKSIEASLSSFKSASQELFGRKSRLTPSEVSKIYKGAKLITSFDDFIEYAKGFLDDDVLQYVNEVLGNDADDTAKLKKVAQLIEDGSGKIGKKLSKEELKAGLDALWDDGGVEGALAAIKKVAKLASVPREKKLALSVKEYLKDFAKQRNAHTWRDFPDPDNWKQGVIDAILDPDTEIVFNLDNIDNPWSALTEVAIKGERARATSWELCQIKSHREMWNRVTWYRNGSIVPNPFE